MNEEKKRENNDLNVKTLLQEMFSRTIRGSEFIEHNVSATNVSAAIFQGNEIRYLRV